MELIVFPDIQAAIINWLTATFAANSILSPVYSRVPNPRPAVFVTVRRVGGNVRNLVVDQASLAVEAWGSAEAEAHDLAQLARAAIRSSVGQVTTVGTIYLVEEFAGPASLPDPDSDQARFTFTVSVAARGTAI